MQLDAKADVYPLLRWPGLTTALAISAGVVAVGLGARLATGRSPGHRPAAAGRDVVDQLIDGSVTAARKLAGRIQHGSLPLYVATMADVGARRDALRLVEIDPTPSTCGTARSKPSLRPHRRRRRGRPPSSAPVSAAALGLGAVGFGVAGLFVAHGAPDLVLTQLLVETVVVVGFVVGLGRLADEFPRSPDLWRIVRLAVAVASAVGVAVALAASPRPRPVSRPSTSSPSSRSTTVAATTWSTSS